MRRLFCRVAWLIVLVFGVTAGSYFTVTVPTKNWRPAGLTDQASKLVESVLLTDVLSSNKSKTVTESILGITESLMIADVRSSTPIDIDPALSEIGALTRTGSTPNYSSTVLADSPAAYFHLADVGSTAVDVIHGNNLAIGSGVTKGVTGIVPTQSSTAMLFPGIKNAADVLTSTGRVAVLEPTSAVTMEAWFKPASLPAVNVQQIVAYGNDNNCAPYGLDVNNVGKVNAFVYAGTTCFGLTATSALAIGSTYHLVAVYTGSTLNLYINGSLTASMAASGALGDYSYGGTVVGGVGGGLTIGEDSAIVDGSPNGTIDEVAIYPTALSASRVLAHYNAGI